MHRFSDLLLVLLALAAGDCLGQQVYRCPDGKGRTLYQQAPCAAGLPIDATGNVIETTPQERAATSRTLREAEFRQAAERGEAVPGMTEDQLRTLWGNPTLVNTDVFDGRVQRQWVFDHPEVTRYVYTDKGVITAVQHRQRRPSAKRECNKAKIADDRFKANSVTRSEQERRLLRSRADAEAARC